MTGKNHPGAAGPWLGPGDEAGSEDRSDGGSFACDRALVLGGGGVTGIAWELGIVAGLASHGIDLRAAELTIGTSAGATVGAQLGSGAPIEELYERQLEGAGAEIPPPAGSSMTFLARLAWTVLRTHGAEGEERLRRYAMRAGEYAKSAHTVEPRTRRRVIEARLPSLEWPNERLLITAVDTDSGERVVFDRSSGVSLLDAVTASCAVPGIWPPVEVGGRVYIDGGVCSPANVDLAEGCRRLLILAPIIRGGLPGTRASEQARSLRSNPRFTLVSPDRLSREAMGRNALDPRNRGRAARAGREQAERILDEVAALFHD